VSAARRVLMPPADGRRRRAGDVVGAGLGTAGLGVTALIAASAQVSTLEREAFAAVNRLPGAAAPGVWVVMQAGSLPAVFVAGGLALAARRPRLALGIMTGGTTAWALAKVVKQAVGRERPAALLHDVIVHGPVATGLGFPSGHAAVAAAIMTVASPYVTRPARIAGWMVVGLVAAARAYVGAHLPLDAAGGIFLGWAVGSVVSLALGAPAAARPGAPAPSGVPLS
jgi:membrane-associated phospholipid phosphatase